MTIPIVIISLDRSAPQVAALTRQLATAGYASTVIAAVDGRQQQPALEAPETIDGHRALRYRQTLLTSSEIGCYLSHYRALRDARAAGDERICILEDDVALEDDFASVFGALEQLPPTTYEFVRLMGLKRHKRKTLQCLPADRQLTRPVPQALGPALQRQLFKLRRGWRRRAYLLQHRQDFLPATRIEGHYGNTARIH